MYNPSFLSRLRELGLQYILISPDTIVGISTFFAIYVWTDGAIPEQEASALLTSFATISASLFAIVLTGLTIITSFTDNLFVYAWKKVEEYDNIITTFQYNLFLPIFILFCSLGLNHIAYNGLGAIFVAAVFVYMLVSLLDLVNLVSRYALQRGEFIKQQMEKGVGNEPRGANLSNEDMREIIRRLNELYESQQKETE